VALHADSLRQNFANRHRSQTFAGAVVSLPTGEPDPSGGRPRRDVRSL
jgi:hypothetical protein